MLINFKKWLRDLLPKKYQVPLKYWILLSRGKLEKEMSLLSELVGKHGLAIDVGGNRGVYTYCLWRNGSSVDVFEPNIECASVLSAWSSNKSSVNIHNMALSNSSGVSLLHIPVDDAGIEHDASASMEEKGFHKERVEEINKCTLDSFEFEKVDLIKIDVEGHESSVITGAIKTIISSRPALLIEIEQRHIESPIEQVFLMILGYGYLGYYFDSNRLNSIDIFDVNIHQSVDRYGGEYINNFIFLHKERVESGEYRALLARCR